MKNLRNTKKVILLALCAVMLLSLCACGRNREESRYYPEPAAAPAIFTDSSSLAGGTNGFAMMAMNDSAVSEEYAYEADSFSAKEAPAAAETAGSGENTQSDLNPEKIIYSSDVTLETTDFESTTASVMALIDRNGGWLESSSVSGANYNSLAKGAKMNRSANYTIRVPNERFDGIMTDLNTLGNVPYSHIYTENVTSQYYDTQARLTTYQAQEKRLIELLDEAQSVSDVIEVENELTEVRYRIESLQTSLRNWDRRVSWSTIYLTVNEVSEYTPEKKISYGKRLANALRYGMEDLGDTFVGFVEVLPVLIFLVLLLIVLILVVKKAVRRTPKFVERIRSRKKKSAEQAGEK